MTRREREARSALVELEVDYATRRADLERRAAVMWPQRPALVTAYQTWIRQAGDLFGELEDHPVAGSDPDHPGLVRIYKSPDAPVDRYENAWHTDRKSVV